MKKLFLFTLLVIPFIFFAQKKESVKPAYAGSVDYAQGGFNGYNYPVKGDSVLVFADGDKIEFRIFSPMAPDLDRDLHLDKKKLKQLSKKEYLNIVSPDKSTPTGKYDMKFICDNAGTKTYTVYLTHFGDGTSAELIILTEYDGRLNDMCIARLTATK